MINHHYACDVKWIGAKRGVLEAPGLESLRVATPPEFGGHAGEWTPEHLYVAAANTCLLTTFLALAERARFPVVSYRAQACGKLTQSPERGLAITEIEISPVIEVQSPADQARALDLCLKAEKHCLIAHSMTAAIHVIPEIRVAEAISAAPGV